jgi:hypothetical protein
MTVQYFCAHMYLINFEQHEMNDVGSIVEKVKTGDESALRSLYDIFSPMMKNVCAGIIRGGGGNR